MKKFAIRIVFLLPMLGLAQYDLDTRYFTINAESLPEVPQVDGLFVEDTSFTGTYGLDAVPTYAEARRAVQINADNYWMPVDISAATRNNNGFVNKQISIPTLQQKQFGFSSSRSVYTGDGATRVKNEVYQEQRGYYFCTRNTPYRFSRGY